MDEDAAKTGGLGALDDQAGQGSDSPGRQFDILVLGGGAAGQLAAESLARAGRSTALVEERLVGGASAYYADTASKTLLHSARRGETWEHAVARRDEVTRHLDDTGAAALMAEAGVTLIRGRGAITGPGSAQIESTEGRAREKRVAWTSLVLATGSEPVVPEIEGLDSVPTWTSDEALSCPDLPRRLVVIGGGPVGCELAQAYAAFGSQVIMVEAADRLLGDEAPFAGDILAESLRRMGIDLRLSAQPTHAERMASGLRLGLTDGGLVEADRLLICTGRRPRTDGCGLETLGLDPEAGIAVDGTCRVATAGKSPVWAVGDVTAITPCTHAARYQARIAAAAILGEPAVRADYRAIPRAVYTTPSVLAVGLSPAQAQEQGIDLVGAGQDLAMTARAAVEDDDRGRVELYADASRGVLVGGAAIGLYAEEWMGEITLAIRAGVPLTVLTDVVHAFPTYGEASESPLRELASRVLARRNTA